MWQKWVVETDTNCVAHRPKIFTICPFLEENLPTTALNLHWNVNSKETEAHTGQVSCQNSEYKSGQRLGQPSFPIHLPKLPIWYWWNLCWGRKPVATEEVVPGKKSVELGHSLETSVANTAWWALGGTECSSSAWGGCNSVLLNLRNSATLER